MRLTRRLSWELGELVGEVLGTIAGVSETGAPSGKVLAMAFEA